MLTAMSGWAELAADRERPHSFYAGVTFNKRKWMARSQGSQEYLGRFETEAEAAAAAAEAVGQTVEALLIPNRLVAAFRAVSSAYVNASALPGDLEAAIAVAQAHRCMFKALPALEVWSLQGKYLPFKEALHRAWINQGRPAHEVADVYLPESQCPGVPEQSAAASKDGSARQGQILKSVAAEAGSGRVLWAILREAAAEMAGQDMSTWLRNCGAKVSHHSGFIALLIFLKVIRKDADAKRTPASSQLVLGLGHQTYKLAGQTPENPLQLKALERAQAAARSLQAAFAHPCRTCQCWLRVQRAGLAVLHDFRAVHLRRATQLDTNAAV